MAEITIRDRIRGYQNEMASGDLMPARAAEILVECSALLGNINDEIRRADVAYARVLLSFYGQEKKANRAKIQAEISPEYEEKRIARDTKELATEMIKSLKYFLRAKEGEWKMGGGM